MSSRRGMSERGSWRSGSMPEFGSADPMQRTVRPRISQGVSRVDVAAGGGWRRASLRAGTSPAPGDERRGVERVAETRLSDVNPLPHGVYGRPGSERCGPERDEAPDKPGGSQ